MFGRWNFTLDFQGNGKAYFFYNLKPLELEILLIRDLCALEHNCSGVKYILRT